ncbi:MAG: hypothetical protein AMXMBFR83_17040 [Phycisphaerae bacterium]
MVLSMSGWALMAVAGQAAEPAEPVLYSRDIKPILSNNCYACHGPDEARRKAGLRLDDRAAALAELKTGGFAIVPGDPRKSLLVERITAAGPDYLMPPPDSGKKLTAEQIDLLQRWIAQGARFDAHWSYVAPRRPPEPAVKDAAWPINPIDRFIRAELEKQSLTPSPEADRRTLIRRLSFDLTGLPPGPEEVDAFLADASPKAYEALVERLLASPRYGERMAVYWLDLVRYGDSKGYHSDNPINVWPYRDYVVRAFNDNKPFDVFTTEQLAGDLLPGAGDEQRIASGFNRLNLHTEEGGAQAKEYLAKYFADRVRAVSNVWLGASMGCAECHDHKFDPYTMKDFYSFGSFFADLEEVGVGVQVPRLTLPTGPQKAQLQRLDSLIARLRQVLETQTPELDAALARWERESAGPGPEWTTLHPVSLGSTGGATLTVSADGLVRVTGANPPSNRYVVAAATELTGITAVRLEVLPAKGKGVGRSGNGNIVLSEFRLAAAPAGDPAALKPVKLQNASADHSQADYDVSAAIDGRSHTGWALLPHPAKAHQAVFETARDLGAPGGTILVFDLDQRYGDQHTIGRFRISVSTARRPVRADGAVVPEEIRAILAVAPDRRAPEQREKLAAHYRGIAPELQPLRDRLAALQKQREAVQASVATMLVSTAVEPRPIRILPRGNWLDDSGPLVTPAVPPFIAPALEVKDRRANRLDLAGWMVDPRNPLPARVFTNRLWKLFFGQGLARTLDDLGSQGAWPSHPELLDWLAVEFIDSGWDVKHVVRLMVLSRTYRQSSNGRPDLRERDPGNALLARQGSFRLDAEFVRDNALLVSGLLVEKIGGPSVKPYQPAGYWSFLNFPVREYYPDKGPDQYRRGLYTWVQRTFPHPSLLAFDAPSREECTAERARSNTPLQALVLLNDPTYVEAARVFAARIIRSGAAAEQRLRFAFRAALGREPRPAEAQILMALCAKHMKEYHEDPRAAEGILKSGDAPAPEGIDRVELAAWTNVARAILNLHETITRY